jgi:hypothetical protein
MRGNGTLMSAATIRASCRRWHLARIGSIVGGHATYFRTERNCFAWERSARRRRRSAAAEPGGFTGQRYVALESLQVTRRPVALLKNLPNGRDVVKPTARSAPAHSEIDRRRRDRAAAVGALTLHSPYRLIGRSGASPRREQAMRTSFLVILAAAILTGGIAAGSVAMGDAAAANTVREAINVCGNTGCYMPQTRAVRQRKLQPLGHG